MQTVDPYVDFGYNGYQGYEGGEDFPTNEFLKTPDSLCIDSFENEKRGMIVEILVIKVNLYFTLKVNTRKCHIFSSIKQSAITKSITTRYLQTVL